MSNHRSEYIERKKNQMVNEMIESELAGEIIPQGDVEAARELCVEYGRQEDEYLVEGAILTCSMATTEVKVVRGQPVGYKSTEKPEERIKTTLRVSENATVINGVRMATVKDRVMGINIKPFTCNCKHEPNAEEEQAIIDDL